MKRLPVETFRRAIPEELAAVARGEPVTLTRRGTALAEVVPVGTWERTTRLHIHPACANLRATLDLTPSSALATVTLPDAPGATLRARVDGDRVTCEATYPDGARRTYVSTDCGATWTEMSKPPTLGELIANLARAGHALVDAVAAALFAGAIRDPDDVRALLDAVEADSTHDTRDALARGVEAAVVAGRVADATGNTGRALVNYAAAYAAWRGDAS